MPSWLKTVLPNKGITLGLDLQGGIHMVLEVDEDRAVETAVDRSVTALQDLLAEKKIVVDSVKRVGHEQITIQVPNAEAKASTQKLVDSFPSFVENESAESAATVVWVLREAETKRIKDSAINQALETIRNRIDQFGVAEPIVQRQGLKQIVVQLPGVKDPKRAKDLIKETALLEFKMLDEDIRLDLPGHVTKDKEAEVLQQFESKLPEGDQILFERVVDKDTGVEFRAPYVVKKRVMLTGDVLSDARVAIGQFNDPYVSITFDSKGGQEFERITAEHVKKRMAVVLDNTILFRAGHPRTDCRRTGANYRDVHHAGGQRSGHRAEGRRPPGTVEDRSRSDGGPIVGAGLHRQGSQGDLDRWGHGRRVHDCVLPAVRAHCRFRLSLESHLSDGGVVGLNGDIDPPWDRRHRVDYRDGG